MKKICYTFLMISSLLLSICPITAKAAESSAAFQPTERVAMKPVKKVYYDFWKEKTFTPSKQVKKDAQKLYKQMKTGKQVKIKYKDKDKDTDHWIRVYSYLNTNYFPFETIHFKDSSVNDDYMVDIIGKGEYKRLVKYNNQVKQVVKNIIKELQIDKNTTKVEAILRINEWFNNNCHYVNYNKKGSNYVNYHMLLYKEGICTDYAYAFKILCDTIGIECAVIGDNELGHVYNACKIDGQLYYIDVTWNAAGNEWLFLTEEEILARGRKIESVNWSIDIMGD